MIVKFGAGSLGLILLIGFVLSRFFPGAQELKAIELSAVVALAVQLTTFTILMPPKERPDPAGGMLMRWGMGAVIRLLSLILYGIIATKIIGLPASPALISLATFFFVTMLLEPMMLTNAS